MELPQEASLRDPVPNEEAALEYHRHPEAVLVDAPSLRKEAHLENLQSGQMTPYQRLRHGTGQANKSQIIQ